MKIFAKALVGLAALCMPATTTAQSIVDIAAGDDRFTTLVAAVTQAGLADTLAGDGSFTVFAPTNDAFMDVDVDKLLEDQWRAHLTSILLYHVLGVEIFSSDLTQVGQTADTLEGSTIEVTSLDPVQINNAEVITPDLDADNGVIHVVDEVLLPPSATNTIVDLAVGNPGIFSTLVSLLSDANLVEALSGDGPFTVFAPSNEAFADVDADTLAALAADPTGLLTDVLLYHVVPGIILAEDLVDGAMPATAEGSTVTVSLDGDGAMINDAGVETANILANNGVIHIIDKVLIPPPMPAPSTPAPTEAPAPEGESIVEIAAGNEMFSILVAALGAADLVGALQGDGPFTVFAPTDDAFAGVDVARLLEDQWSAHLEAILLYHVVSGKIMSTDLSLGLAATTLEGSDITVTSYPDPVMIDDATVIQADIEATNGVIHVVDEVLLPPSATNDIVDIALSDDTFSTLVDLVTLANLVETLQGDGPFTVFAPTNDAFAKLPQATVDALTSDVAALTEVLLYHVVPGVILSSDLTDGAMVATVQGSDVTASLDPVMINDANVIAADILASNGVIHVIDTVLIPPPAVSQPTAPPASADGYQRLVSVDYTGPGSACVEVKDSVATNGQRLILGDCTVAKGGWRFDDMGMVHSELDDDFCMQAGYGGHDDMAGRVMRVNHCNAHNGLQMFVWKEGEGLRPEVNKRMCVVWRGATADNAGDPIILLPCGHVEDKKDWTLQ